MAKSVTNTAQLSTFSVIRGIITSNSTLSPIFNTSNIYQFDPLAKSLSFTGFPYIHIEIPSTSKGSQTMNNSATIKSFDSTITIVMEDQAKDNLLTYANALIKALEGAESTFNSSGYYDVNAEFTGSDRFTINQKQLVYAELSLTLQGNVER